MPSSTRPNSTPASSRRPSGTRSSVSALLPKAQTVTSAAPAAAGSNTASVFSRCGTRMSQIATPASAARMLPLEKLRSMVTINSPSSGRRERRREHRPRPRAEPKTERNPHRGRDADRVPVAVGLAQAPVDLVLGQPPGGDLRQEPVQAHDGQRQQHPVQHGLPAGRRQPHRRDPGREGPQVGKRAVGLDPRVRGVQRPQDRQARQTRERDQRREGGPTMQRRVGGEQQSRRDHQAGHHNHPDLDQGRAAQLEPPVADERDRAQRARERQRDGQPGAEAHAAREHALATANGGHLARPSGGSVRFHV